jgi:uncharacterized membrane protein
MNHSFYSADRSTHLKIVAVALIAGVSILGYGIAVRSKGDGSAYAQQNIQVIKAGKPLLVGNSEAPTIR